MSAAQKKVIDDHCTNEWSLEGGGPLGRASRQPACRSSRAIPAHEVYPISADQVAEWRKAAEPLEKTWSDNVKKAGGDGTAIMKELKESLAKHKAAY